ncbi:MAG: histidine kinase, partial [Streptosporangiaceae bacterium]
QRRATSAGQAWLAAAVGRHDSRTGDAMIAALCVATLVALLAVDGQLTGWHHWVVAAAVAVACCCPLARRGHPQLAAMAAAALGGVVALTGSDTDAGAFGVLFIPAFLVCYSLGADRRLVRSVAALVILGVSLEFAAGQWNPFVIVIVIGPFALGVVSRSRRALAEQLAVRGRELAAEEELFATEAARYERTRIARELHDIVAHSVSVMVIQAAAGQRLTGRDPALAAEAFDTIGAVARQAEAEIGQLVDLLDTGKPTGDDGLRLIAELVTRAASTGLDVGCRFDVAAERLSARAAQTAYRVVQESLTNALRHAPGAPVQITVTGNAGQIQLSVASGPSAARRSGLEASGTGRGLAGMRERVRECGGEFAAGPTAVGWAVTAAFPAEC